ncbi:hypothetical protein Pmani_017674 [Petrolisthes manimaculis]|uniref:Uncharacterized protein n=1 Tax=Petrolisthes manimaculis TaxID=1843537 RepID=A0AAE1U573_9EUCA|nr:hypothetical protein Pmani_017674 [Petrolisthes manimaculis]
MAGNKKDLTGLLHLQMEPQTKRMKMMGGNDNRNSGNEGRNNVGKGGNEEGNGGNEGGNAIGNVGNYGNDNRNKNSGNEGRNYAGNRGKYGNEVGKGGNCGNAVGNERKDGSDGKILCRNVSSSLVNPSFVNLSLVNPSSVNLSFVNTSSVNLSLVNPPTSSSENPPYPLLQPNNVRLTPILATEEGECGGGGGGGGGGDVWPELVHLATLKLKDKRHTARVIKDFSVSMSNASLCHLKRVRKLAQRKRREEGEERRELEERGGRGREEGEIEEERREEMEKEGKELEERKAIEGERKTKQKQDLKPSEDAIFVYLDTLENLGVKSAPKLNHNLINQLSSQESKNEHLNTSNNSNHNYINQLSSQESTEHLNTSNNSNHNYINQLSSQESTEVFDRLADKNVDVSLFEPVIYIFPAAKNPPRLRKTYDKVNSLWPCVFHEDKYLASLFSGKFFSSGEVEKIVSRINLALELSVGGGREGEEGGGGEERDDKAEREMPRKESEESVLPAT